MEKEQNKKIAFSFSAYQEKINMANVFLEGIKAEKKLNRLI